MKRWLARTLVGLWVVLAVLAGAVGAGVPTARAALDSIYPEPLAASDAVRADVAAAPRPAYDEKLPTAVVLLGPTGANVADVLAPYEVLAVSGAFNVYTVAPERWPVPLTGGLDVVPHFSFAELAERFPTGVDVVVVPQLTDVRTPITDPLRVWVNEQAADGATVLGVCVGAELLATAGLLDGRPATAHWLKLDMGGLASDEPQVRWTRGVRYVDDGQIITTAGVLTGVDGALRVLERFVGEAKATEVASEVRWRFYQPGRAAPAPASVPEPPDVVALLNMAHRQPAQLGVVLTDGVGEIELASAFRPYTELSYVARLHTVTVDGEPIRSRHGLTFVPRGILDDTVAGFDRLVVPGRTAEAARDPQVAAVAERAGVPVAYLHSQDEFPFDGALRDVAATTDVTTATWVGKTLVYPVPQDATGDAWPWAPTVRALGFALLAGLLAVGVVLLFRRRPAAG